jgi:cytochrome c-type biogenesis protein CcmH/NrfG
MRLKRPTVNDLNTLGVQFYRSEAYDLAIVQFEEAVRLLPESAAIRFNLGGAYYGKHRIADAEREFRMALQLDPHHVRAHWFRGLCLERMERFREALAEFEWVLGHSVGTREARSAREEIQVIAMVLADKRENARHATATFPMDETAPADRAGN